MLLYPFLQRPLPVFTGKCAIRSLRTSSRRCAHLLDGLFWAFRGLPGVTVCVAGLPLPEDGRPLFGVWSVVFTRIREDASCARNCLLFHRLFARHLESFAVTLVEEPGIDHSEDDGVPKDVPHLAWICCRHQQCMASQLQCRFCWLYPSIKSFAQVQVQLRMTQVWRPCCHTIWQHRCCDSSPLWRHSYLSSFPSSSSHLQGHSLAGALAWLFPRNEFRDQGASLIMEPRWSSCLHKCCSSDLLEVWRQASSQHHLTSQVQVWLLSDHARDSSSHPHFESPWLWLASHILLNAAVFPLERRVVLFWYHLQAFPSGHLDTQYCPDMTILLIMLSNYHTKRKTFTPHIQEHAHFSQKWENKLTTFFRDKTFKSVKFLSMCKENTLFQAV